MKQDSPVTRKPMEPVLLVPNEVDSDRIGWQRPKHNIVPTYASPGKKERAAQFLKMIGVELDDWQEYVLMESLNLDKRGKFAATEVGLLVPRQQGKGLGPDEKVLTRDGGWKTISQLAVGDRLMHPDGGTTVVTHIFDERNLDCYRVSTTDGRSMVVDGDHLWMVTDKLRERSVGPRGARKRHFETCTLTTREMFESGTSRYGGTECRYVLPRQHGLRELPKANLPIDPYLLGAWLGDGTSRDGTITAHPGDLPHWRSEFDVQREFHPVARCSSFRVVGLFAALRGLQLLSNKHVPDSYLFASDLQREALLQGLMDTDGSITVDGQAEFCNTNKQLAEAVLFLARSLGWRATITTKKTAGSDAHLVKFTPKRTDLYAPFRMARKLARIGETGGAGRFTVSIKSIEQVESVPTRCIKVDRADGLFLATDLIPTHNTVIAEARELVGLFVLGEQVIIHSAQLFATAKESFLRQVARIRRCPELLEMIHKTRTGNDNVSIEMINGSRLLYQARGNDPARGFSADLIVYDEAYGLTPEVISASLHTLSARPNPQLWYCSSTGKEDSQVLFELRERGLERAPRVALFEWCADSGCDPHDVDQWYQANPALGIRLDLDFIEVEGNATKWGKEFVRERLGLWADNSLRDVITEAEWKACADDDAYVVGDELFAAVDVSPFRDYASVAICGHASDGRRHVELIECGDGTDWVLDFMKKLMASSQPPMKIVIQGGGAPGSLIAPLMEAGADLYVIGQADIGKATGEFLDAVLQQRMSHPDEPVVEKCLTNATRYNIGSKQGEEESAAFGFARKETGGKDITPIVACCYAFYGMSKYYAELAKEPVLHHVGTRHGGRIW